MNSPTYMLIVCIAILAGACKSKSPDQHTENSAAVAGAVVNSSFKVWGNCEQCKETIENALKVKGVSKADWNTETKQIRVSYDSTKISLDQIQKSIAAAGYDNEKYKGDDNAYNSLPECCQYERK
jgi:mercuric ion binding protein